MLGGGGQDIFEFDFSPLPNAYDVTGLTSRDGELDRALDIDLREDDHIRLLYTFDGDSDATALNPFDEGAFYHDMLTLSYVNSGTSDAVGGSHYHQIAFSPTEDVTMYVRLFAPTGDANPIDFDASSTAELTAEHFLNNNISNDPFG